MSSVDATFSNSRYNFRVPLEADCLLYNSFSGAVLQLNGPDAAVTATLLSSRPHAVDTESLPDALLVDLLAGNFLVPAGLDELQADHNRFWAARPETALALTLTATPDCYISCYYS